MGDANREIVHTGFQVHRPADGLPTRLLANSFELRSELAVYRHSTNYRRANESETIEIVFDGCVRIGKYKIDAPSSFVYHGRKELQ